MPSTGYVVASAKQLGGPTARPRRKKQTVVVQLDVPSADADTRLRHEKRSVSDKTLVNDESTTLEEDHKADQIPTIPRHEKRSVSDKTLVNDESTPFEEDRKADTIPKIYFSPVLSSSSTASFSKPQAPPKTPPTANPAMRTSDTGSAYQTGKLGKLSVTVDQVNSIVRALTQAPLIKSSLQNQHLTFAAIDGTPSDKSSALYSLSNRQFATRQAQKIAPDLHLLNGSLGGACLFDASETNSVVYKSAGHAAGSMNIGDCAHMTLPYGLEVASRLDYLGPSVYGIPAKVILQSVHSTIDRKTGDVSHFLSVEEDMTTSCTKAAFVELARIAEISVRDIVVVADADSTIEVNELDWIAAADQLLASCETADLVDNVLKEIRAMTAKTCAMQTLTLMVELSKTKACNRDFLILLPGLVDDKGRIRKTTVPFCSQSLSTSLDCNAGAVDAVAARHASRRFIADVVASVAPCSYSKQEFEIKDRSGLSSIFRCTPMYAGENLQPKAWVIFIEPRARQALLARGHL